MTKDEALKLALDALETSMYPQQKQLQAITAIKEALANEALDKMAENARELGLDYEPPQRTWVGLTDGDIDDLSRTMVNGNKSVNWLCQAIEAKLKEKNT